jgi:hypothetical protein
VAVVSQELTPHIDVPVLHGGEPTIDVGSPRVSFGLGQLPIEEGGIGLVFEVVDPFVGRGGTCSGHGGFIVE